MLSERLYKTSICSVVFLDIIDYSLKPVSEQIEGKQFFNALISEAIKDIAEADRIILDTGDGAAIALLGAPEEALFISLTIRDGILKHNQEHKHPLHVRIGINLGPVRVVSDINSRPNIIGDGINVAQRVMSFAEPNQILVARSYYEVTSRLTKDITNMFSYSGIKHDKHVREHEVYVIRSPSEVTAPFIPEPLDDDESAELKRRPIFPHTQRKRWMMAGAGGALVLLAGLALFAKLHTTGPELVIATSVGKSVPPSLTPVVEQVAETHKAPEPKVPKYVPSTAVTEPEVESGARPAAGELASGKTAEAPIEKKAAKRKPRSSEVATAAGAAGKAARGESTSAEIRKNDDQHKPVKHTEVSQQEEPVRPKQESSGKFGWEALSESFKQGADKKNCTQAEIALHQCN
ncbi:MAG TPA: adenylate/guanylate cyclase domain-containing protein [Methylophilaceae bacterium]|nr:adenylate/guanylate cyclase domain-containing protein [Methylophilaceae bacterium]